MYEQVKRGQIGGLMRALLAFQFCQRDPDGYPSEDARLGALWMADYYAHHRAFMRGFGGGDDD